VTSFGRHRPLRLVLAAVLALALLACGKREEPPAGVKAPIVPREAYTVLA